MYVIRDSLVCTGLQIHAVMQCSTMISAVIVTVVEVAVSLLVMICRVQVYRSYTSYTSLAVVLTAVSVGVTHFHL